MNGSRERAADDAATPAPTPVTDGDRRRRAGWLLATAVLTLAGVAWTALVEGGWAPLASTDHDVAGRLHRFAVEHSGWTRANRILTDWMWDPITMRLLTAALVGWLLWSRAYRLAAWVFTTSLAGLGVQHAVKAWTARPRPHWSDPVDSAHNWAYPSGHVMTATLTGALFGVVAVWLAGRAVARAVGAVAVVSALGVGFTRVYLGVHWFSDVVGGWVLGLAVVAAGAAVFAPWRDRLVVASG